MIFLRDTTSSAETQGRALAARYGVRFLMEMLALPAFVAITTPPALAQLRCDPAVREIVYDGLERREQSAKRVLRRHGLTTACS